MVQITPLAEVAGILQRSRALDQRDTQLGEQAKRSAALQQREDTRLKMVQDREALSRQTMSLDVLSQAMGQGYERFQAMLPLLGQTGLYDEEDMQTFQSIPKEAFSQVREKLGRVIEGVNQEGESVFFQASDSGNVNTLEGVAPPGPTQKEQADARAAVAAADSAELKVAETERKAEAAVATKDNISDLADSILKSDYQAIFGSFDGATPPVLQGSVDVNAEIDKLVNLLTLENTDKMTGVLSESDIKILRDAGTILSNRRISDSKAKEELESIRDVFSRNKNKFDEAASGTFTSSGGITVTIEDE